MKILFTFYIPSGGVETLNRHRALALKEAGYTCHFLYLVNAAGLQNVKDTKIFVTNDNEEIKALLHTEDYDLIVVCSDYLFLQRIRSFGYKGKIIFEIQGFGTEIEELVNVGKRNIISYSDAVISPLTPHLTTLIDKYFPSMKKYYFHNCIDIKTFTYIKMPKPKNTIIGWVGRIEDNKNWRYFLRISAELKKTYPNLKVWIFHDPDLSEKSEQKKLNKVISQLNIDNLDMFSNVPNRKMPEYYSMIGDSGGFLCSTSKVEGFGYAVLEAMSCSCPVVTTDSDGVKSFVTHNVTGKIIPQNKVRKAVKEARELINNESIRNQMKEDALKMVENKFTLKQYQLNFKKMVEDLCEQH